MFLNLDMVELLRVRCSAILVLLLTQSANLLVESGDAIDGWVQLLKGASFLAICEPWLETEIDLRLVLDAEKLVRALPLKSLS